MTCIHEFSREGLEQVQKIMVMYDDRHAKVSVKHAVGDIVIFNKHNLKIQRLFRKLNAKLHGPFKLLKVI
jgi:hypothetical protein